MLLFVFGVLDKIEERKLVCVLLETPQRFISLADLPEMVKGVKLVEKDLYCD